MFTFAEQLHSGRPPLRLASLILQQYILWYAELNRLIVCSATTIVLHTNNWPSFRVPKDVLCLLLHHQLVSIILLFEQQSQWRACHCKTVLHMSARRLAPRYMVTKFAFLNFRLMFKSFGNLEQYYSSARSKFWHSFLETLYLSKSNKKT